MQPDMLFFLGIFYSLFGGIVTAGWLLTRSGWNLYGAILLAIGLALIALRPKPPWRFFTGHLNTVEREEVRHYCREVDPVSGIAQVGSESEVTPSRSSGK